MAGTLARIVVAGATLSARAMDCNLAVALATARLKKMTVRPFLMLCLIMAALGTVSQPRAAFAQADAVLEFKFQPTKRAQIAIWIESADGDFLATARLTEAVAYRGIGNRPGASEMNSGYRWPYGRREGALPVWASRRARAADAKQFHRVIFQNRSSEGRASRTGSDQSKDDYYCLSFNKASTQRDALDAVSCASVFTSDKGRFITATDVSNNYAEPYEPIGSSVGIKSVLSLESLYPPRRDVTRCTASGCYDHADVEAYGDHARDVMPDIDVVTMATPPGNTEQNLLFTVPPSWTAGEYLVWIEVNVEGDYNSDWNATSYPTPLTPSSDWDSWAKDYGYAYRGQPSVVYSVPFSLGTKGETVVSTSTPAGRASWDHWSASFGAMESMGSVSDEPVSAPGSGADRLRVRDDGSRFAVRVIALNDIGGGVEDGGVPDDGGVALSDAGMMNGAAGSTGMQQNDAGAAAGTDGAGADGSMAGEGAGPDDVVIIETDDASSAGPVGAIEGLSLHAHDNRLRAHEWISMRLQAPRADRPLNSYDVRVATRPIRNESDFLREGRPAKNATLDAEGATALMLPVDVSEGTAIDADIGDLAQSTEYWIAVRAVDELNRRGPISVGRVSTLTRRFATVTPCFVATASYGSPLANEVGVLRRVRDRYLLSHAPGRALVALYYDWGPVAARFIAANEARRSWVRAGLEPVVAMVRWLGL